jgi:hypothetical protein
MTHPPALDLVVAAAGFGRSTVHDARCPREGVVVSARNALDQGLPDRPWIGIDDLHDLTSGDQLELIAGLAGLNARTRVVLSSRRPLLPEVCRAIRRRIRMHGPDDLALSPYDVHRVLVDEYGVLDPEVPVEVHALTVGWPALVHFAADALARQPGVPLREALTSPAGAATYWIRSEVLDALPSASQRILGYLSGLGPITPQACDAVADVLGATEWQQK